jgi:putative glutamine amidotransferase
VRAGGTLHYHLPSDRADAGEHRLRDPAARHAVRIEPGTRLAAILGAGELGVNSRHHQAVARPGAGLRVSARAADGVIEAIESAELPFCVGVQWHPEDLDDPRLLRAFVGACAARAGAAARS